MYLRGSDDDNDDFSLPQSVSILKERSEVASNRSRVCRCESFHFAIWVEHSAHGFVGTGAIMQKIIIITIFIILLLNSYGFLVPTFGRFCGLTASL